MIHRNIKLSNSVHLTPNLFDYVFGDLIKKYKIETAAKDYKSKYEK